MDGERWQGGKGWFFFFFTVLSGPCRVAGICDEAKTVNNLVNAFADGLATSVPCVDVDLGQEWAVLVTTLVLQLGDVLEGVEGCDTVVVITCLAQHCGVLTRAADVVERRVLDHVVEVVLHICIRVW